MTTAALCSKKVALAHGIPKRASLGALTLGARLVLAGLAQTPATMNTYAYRTVCNTGYKSNPCWSSVPPSWWRCNGHSPAPHPPLLFPSGGSTWKTGGGPGGPVWTRGSWTLADGGVSQTFPGHLARLARGVPLPLIHTKSAIRRSTVPRCRTAAADLERDGGLGGDAISCRRSDIGPDTFHLPNPWAGTWCLNHV